MEVPDSPSAAVEGGPSPQVRPAPKARTTTLSPVRSRTCSPRAEPTVDRFDKDPPRQDKRVAIPLSARIEVGNEAPMSFHRRGERETPPLPVSGREASPDDVEEIRHEQSGPELVAAAQRMPGAQAMPHHDRARLPSPPRCGRVQVPMHAPVSRRRDDRGPPPGARVVSDIYPVAGPPRGQLSGRGWVRDPGRRAGRGHDHRGGYHHDASRRNQRR